MATLTIDQSRAIIAAALAHGHELRLKPLGVAVLDQGGHLIAFEREDGSSYLRAKIATGKASGALAMGVSSRRIAGLADERPTLFAALGAIAPDGILPAAGGVLIVDAAGELLGAVGVSGDSSDQDEVCAIAAVRSIGLQVPD